ncbi:uncharacterized protein LOC119659937 [Hermetia illucens]|uniref:uncharacterized protein LOC119659937 n=1 Tax=Hermetia illucens TaxID=343691 RepID=UPI0018CC0900|nr:uncharacterized protein LOC119659937 [Hermetia illucens]
MRINLTDLPWMLRFGAFFSSPEKCICVPPRINGALPLPVFRNFTEFRMDHQVETSNSLYWIGWYPFTRASEETSSHTSKKVSKPFVERMCNVIHVIRKEEESQFSALYVYVYIKQRQQSKVESITSHLIPEKSGVLTWSAF